MEYRKADMSDIDALAQMRVAMLCEDMARSEDFKTLISDGTKRYMSNGFSDGSFISWVAEQNGNIIAMCGVTVFPLLPNDWCPDGKTAYIGGMYTVPAFRRQGAARRLLELIVDEAKRRGCERILLHSSDMGKRLYEAYGFKISESTMALYPFGITPAV